MVAHRLSTAAQCDRIAVIEGGRVVEMGEPGGRGWGDINRGRRQGEDHGAVELGFQAMTPHLPVLQGTQSRPPAVAWGAGAAQLCGHSSSPIYCRHTSRPSAAARGALRSSVGQAAGLGRGAQRAADCLIGVIADFGIASHPTFSPNPAPNPATNAYDMSEHGFDIHMDIQDWQVHTFGVHPLPGALKLPEVMSITNLPRSSKFRDKRLRYE